jgi:hypothetical protein
MTNEKIYNLFKQRYNQNNWKQFLGEAFAKSRLFATPEILTGIDSNVASQVQKLGYITLNENGIERQIAVYEVTLAQGIILERNRVGLRNLLRKYWKDIDAAFIAYHRPETPNWRFTYVSELTGYDADGEFVKIKTEPKRYTYVLGEGESTRTAAERFTVIATKGSKATLDDVKEAFSVEKLSKAFFDEYKKHYNIFCDFMVSKPNIRQTIFNGKEKGIRDFNKKLLGRIVFLYFIQKKGWLGVPVFDDWGKGDFNFLTHQFESFSNKDLFYQQFLSPLFFETLNQKRDNDIAPFLNNQENQTNPKNKGSNSLKIPYLNGGLFEEDDKKHRNLIFPSNLFKSLFDFFNQYNFTIYEDDPNDHTVAVDPEMLGHIFENLLEDNKDKGAYYTPKEIVHYMCQESLIEYLATWFEIKGYEVVGYIGFDKPDQPKLFSANEGRKGQLVMETYTKGTGKQIDRLLIEKLLKKKLDDDDKKLIKKHSAEFHTALDNVKICDPAIGSGAFPMGLLHEIFTAKQTLHTFEHGNTKTFDASAVKLNIIQNSIYGVDIEKGAVDIARLRFWLSLIVDEEKPKALPNLDYKIVVGNSLVSKLGDDIIDIDWSLDTTKDGLFGADLAKQKGELLKKISKEQKEFFSPDSDKKKLAADIRKLKIDLLITQLELMIKITNQETEPKSISYKDKKKFVQATELYHKTIGWKHSIKDLQTLKTKPELPLQFFDWKLDFPEIMNPALFETNSSNITVANVQILALNTQIEAINLHLYQHEINIHLIYLQANIAQSQITFVKQQLAVIEEKISTIFGKITSVENNIVNEPDLSFTYSITGINKGIEEINQRIIAINPIIENQNPNIGFDIVIGNPPYVVVNDNVYLKNYTTAKCCDLYCYFFELATKLTKRNGFLTFITPSLFIKGLKFKSLQNLLISSIDELKIIDKGDKVFKDVSMPTAITLFKNKKPATIHTWQELFLNNPITTQMRKNSFVLGSLAKIQRGFEIGKNKTKKNKTEIPFVTGEDVGKYFVKNIRFISKDIFDKNAKGDLSYYKSPRVLIRETGSNITALFLEDELFCNRSLYSIIPIKTINPKYLTALLCSNLIQFFYQSEFKTDTNIFPKIRIAQVKRIPIISATNCVQKLISKIIDNVIKLKSEAKDTNALEQEIDNLVYRLYELSYDEVKVIDPKFGLTKKEYEDLKLE